MRWESTIVEAWYGTTSRFTNRNKPGQTRPPSFEGYGAAVLQGCFGEDDSHHSTQSFTFSYPVAPSTAFGGLHYRSSVE